MKTVIIILSSISLCFLGCRTSSLDNSTAQIVDYQKLPIQIDSIIDSGTYPIVHDDGDFGSSTAYYKQKTLLKRSSDYYDENYSGILEIESFYHEGIIFLTRIIHHESAARITFQYEIYHINNNTIEKLIIGDKMDYIGYINKARNRIKNKP